MQKIHALGKN